MAKNNDSGQDSGEQLTPLQRYLAKQKADGAAAPSGKSDPKSESTGSSRFRASNSSPPTSDAVSSAPEPRGERVTPRSEDSAPQAPPTDSAPFWRAKGERESDPAGQSAGQSTSVPPTQPAPATSGVVTPAPFFQRALAYFIDLFLVSKIVSLVTFSSVAGFYFSTNISEWLYSPIQLLVFQIIAFVYYGWFYREKGATPGKLIFGLEISTDAGLRGDERLSYLRTYLRESIGKMVSATLLFMGFFLALFRNDHRALHDLLFETKVVKRKKKSSGT